MKKWVTYFNERFPLQSHIPIIGAFTLSAIGYSYKASGQIGAITPIHCFVAFVFTFSLFLLLRISDEFKDHEDDLKYRTYLPVPRGLIKLSELRFLAVIIICLQCILVYLFPFFLFPYLVTACYLLLMHYEFFMVSWLKKHQVAYVVSHMFIIPLVDLVASSAHWCFSKIEAPKQLLFFFLVSFFNGIILEVGRKIKPVNKEEIGVISYTSLLGQRKAIYLWLTLLFLTLVASITASIAIESSAIIIGIQFLIAIVCSIPALNYLKTRNTKNAKYIEISSGIWTIFMYFSLGIFPYLI